MANKFPCPAKDPVPTIAPIPVPNTHSVALNFGAQETIMQVEAIYDNGKLEFVNPLKLKHERVRLLVTVPDEEVDTSLRDLVSEDVLLRARAMREHLDAVRDAPLLPDDALPDLTPKQIDRIQAFELREDR